MKFKYIVYQTGIDTSWPIAGFHDLKDARTYTKHQISITGNVRFGVWKVLKNDVLKRLK